MALYQKTYNNIGSEYLADSVPVMQIVLVVSDAEYLGDSVPLMQIVPVVQSIWQMLVMWSIWCALMQIVPAMLL
jgi:hypothetical protein